MRTLRTPGHGHTRQLWRPAGRTAGISGHGTVFTYTVNYLLDIRTPYVITIVGLAKQREPWITANIFDCKQDSVKYGITVDI